MAPEAAEGPDDRRAPGAARYVRRLLQHRATAPGDRTAHAGGGVRGQAESHPEPPDSRDPRAVPGRRDKIDITGRITIRHNSRMHHVGLGRKLTGTRVIALVNGLHVRVVTQDGELLRDLILDPSRHYQPHGRG